MTRRTLIRRRHHPLSWLALGLCLLLAVDTVAWALWFAWHLPWLLAFAAVVIACKRGRLHRRALAWLLESIRAARPVVRAQVVADDAERLRAELTHVRDQVARLEDAANRPIDAVIASYERIGRQYGDAAVGRTGVRK